MEQQNPPEIYHFRFTGKTEEFTRLFYRSLFFSAISLGTFGFRAIADLRRYVLSHVELLGEGFRYHARGMESFLNTVRILFIMIPIGILMVGYHSILVDFWVDLNQYSPVPWLPHGISVFVLLIVLSWISLRYYRYRLRKTSWMQIRFHFEGHTGAYLLLFARGLFFTVITLGLYYPLMEFSLRKYKIDNTALGNSLFVFEGDRTHYYWQFVHGALWSFLTLGVYSFWWYARVKRYMWSRTRLENGPVFFNTIRGKDAMVAGMQAAGVFLLGAGLTFPWAYIHWKRSLISKHMMIGAPNFSALIGDGSPRTTQMIDEPVDMDGAFRRLGEIFGS